MYSLFGSEKNEAKRLDYMTASRIERCWIEKCRIER